MDLLYKYSEQPSNPSSSSSHFSAGVSWSDSVDANRQAPDSTKNFTIAKLLQLAAQCNGVHPSESWAFTSHPNSTKNLRKRLRKKSKQQQITCEYIRQPVSRCLFVSL